MTRPGPWAAIPARWVTVTALAVGAALSAAPAPGATARLLADLRRGAESSLEWSDVRQLTPIGDRVVFVAAGPTSGSELWVSDGTQLGTEMLRDIAPGPESPEELRLLGSTGDVAFFYVRLGNAADAGVWRTDGTRAGTFHLGFGSDWNPYGLYVAPTAAVRGSTLFVAGCAFSNGCEVWRSDGDAASSVRLALVDDARFPLGIASMTAAGSSVYFVAEVQGAFELWRSDGTPAGTAAVELDGISPSPHLLAGVGSRLLFVGWSDEDEQELFASDGTAAGTVPLTAFAAHEPFEHTGFLRVLGGIAYFVLDDVIGGTDLWRSDGIAAGTRRVTAFGYAVPFAWAFRPESLAQLGPRLLFPASDGLSGLRLWSSGGDPDTTAVVSGCPGGCPSMDDDARLVVVGTRIVFAARNPSTYDRELWSTDGTGPGTQRLVAPLLCASCSAQPPRIVEAGGRAYFLGFGPGATGLAAWRTDGTAAGTRVLAAVGARSPSGVDTFEAVPLAGKALFVARDSAQDEQLWLTDDTAEGTAPLSVLRLGEASSLPTFLTPLGGEGILFSANDGTGRALWASGGTPGTAAALPGTESDSYGTPPISRVVPHQGVVYFRRGEPVSGSQLWRTDGTAAGTRKLTSFASGGVGELVPFAGKILFSVVDETGRNVSFWQTDGTVQGTAELFPLPPQTGYAMHLAALGSELYFVAAVGPYLQVWRSDGTLAGTRALTAFDGYLLDDDDPPSFTRLGAYVYFRAGLGVYPDARLWRTDGTAAGTTAVFADPAGPGVSGVTHLTVLDGSLLHFAPNADSLPALYRTDGTAAGIVELARLTPPRTNLQHRADITVIGNRAFLVADDGVHGEELWITDGTVAGTRIVRDLAPGSSPSRPRQLTVAGGRLFFTATDGVHGLELWESDGTAAGTRMVQDLAPGGASSQPDELTANGGSLYFTADDGVWGREVWTLPLGQTGCQSTSTVLCLNNGRYEVVAHWQDFARNSGAGRAVALTADTGYFWFFGPDNVEVILKVLDGRGVNGHVWVFYGALSSVEYTLTVTDTQTGAARRYVNVSGRLGSVADTIAFGPRGATPSTTSDGPAVGAAVAAEVSGQHVAPKATCTTSSTRLCLRGGRFAVEARWAIPGSNGAGQAVSLTGDTGYLWFFNADNVELVVKVLDGRPVNGKFWVFYGALSDVDYTLTVTDTATGRVKEYHNPRGRLASAADTSAF